MSTVGSPLSACGHCGRDATATTPAGASALTDRQQAWLGGTVKAAVALFAAGGLWHAFRSRRVDRTVSPSGASAASEDPTMRGMTSSDRPRFSSTANAYPTPFHTHAFAGGHAGNAYASTLTSPKHAATGSALSSQPSRSMTSTAHSQRDVSPFLQRRGARDAGMPKGNGSTSGAPASTTPTRPLPDHIHSATCGCGVDSTIASDDQLIEDEGAERFLNDLKFGVQAGDALANSMASAEGTLANSATPQTAKWNLHRLLDHNYRFVAGKQYEPFLTDRYPYKKLVVVTCMDTRLTQLLPMALDLKNGDAKIIKVAGAMVAHPFGSVMRSILVAVYGLGAEHILVIGHHDCGMTGMDPNKILTQAKQRGISEKTFATLKAAGLDLDSWLSGFDNVRSSVLHSVETIKNHPLLNFEETNVKASEAIAPGQTNGAANGSAANTVAKTRIPKITVTGFVICPTTGKLDLVTPADPATQALIEKGEARLLEVQNSQSETAAGHRDAFSAP